MGWMPSPLVFSLVTFVASWMFPNYPLSAAICRLSEFACSNGQCISINRYCDGTDDCGDRSDETVGCTNCNRTFYGEVNIKYPLRITEPFQRHQPFFCKIAFIAPGKEFGDIIQLTFLSFQVGTLEPDRNQTPVCHKGHLQMVEPSGITSALRSQQTRGFSQLISALKEPTKQLSTLFDVGKGEPEFGRFCGEIIGRSATFYSEGNNVTLIVVIPGRIPVQPYSFSVYLTYKFLPRLPTPTYSYQRHAPIHYGTRLVNTYCDRVLVNCDRKHCVIRSPNFPGFYLRNITCHFWVRQDHVPRGRHASIILSQNNEYKISIYTGRSSPGAFPHSALTEDCFSDVVRIYDGPTVSSPLLMEFCGAGTLPEIISSGPEVLVQLHSVPSQSLHNSRVEINVRVRFSEASEYKLTNGKCDFLLDGSKIRHGLVYSPRHTVPRNTTCTFHLKGSTPFDRIWIYFLMFFVEDKHQWSRRETCEIGRLEIYEMALPPGERRDSEANSEEPSYRFCEKSSPKVCARAADHPNYVPVRPCKVPTESYLSRGSEMLIKYNIFTNPELSITSSTFMARYEFIDMRQYGTPAKEGVCDRHIDSRIARYGSVVSPKNVFLYGRGGSSNISCVYDFIGTPSERVVITFKDIRLKSSLCDHIYEPVLQQHTCRMRNSPNGRTAFIQATERSGSIFSHLGCFCDIASNPKTPLVIESVTSTVKLTFTVNQMSPFEDFTDFGFEAIYEFLPITTCDTGINRKNGSSEGEVVFKVPNSVESRSMPLRCRWLLEAAPYKYLYLKFKGSDGSAGCRSGNRIIVYAGMHVQPIAVVCLGDGIKDQEFDVFSSFWYNDSHSGRLGHKSPHIRDHVYIEVIASHSQTFRFRWLEVTKPFFRTHSGQTLRNVNCLFECPELNACISPELWCDGTVHCPSGYDETPNHCHQFPTPYVAAGAGGGVVLLLIVLALVTHRCRQRGKFKESRPVPTEDFPMDSPHV